MSQTLILVIIISLISIAVVFIVVGFLRFRLGTLSESNSTRADGILVGFRHHYTTDQLGDSGEDYKENKRGHVPIVQISLDGEKVGIAAAVQNKTLTGSDIGKHVKVRYRRTIGVTLIVDDKESLYDYNKVQNILFWIFIVMSVLCLIIAFVVYEIFGNTTGII